MNINPSVEMNSILFQRDLGEHIFWELNRHHFFFDMKCMHNLENQYGTNQGGLEDYFPFQLGDF